jgi:hypothetical protein
MHTAVIIGDGRMWSFLIRRRRKKHLKIISLGYGKVKKKFLNN